MTGVSHQALIGGSRKGTMIEAINGLGLQSGLKLCLDAGDAASYTSGQSWLDRSGNGYDFFRGTTSASQATDPTFNGTAGGQSASEYWSFDGGDYFTYDSSNEAWMDNMNKNNAIFSWATWVYITGALPVTVGATYTPTLSRGCWDIVINAAPILRFNVYNASDRALIMDSTAAVPLNAWVFLALTLNEAAGTATMQINGTQEAKTSTYSSPLANGSDLAMKIGAEGDGTFPLASGSRLHSFMAWEGTALSAGQILSLYDSTKVRFGH